MSAVRGCCLLLLIFGVSWERASSDVVHLQSGDRITGTILGMQSTEIRISTEYAGEMLIDAAFVRWVESDGSIMVLQPGREPRVGFLEEYDGAPGLRVGEQVDHISFGDLTYLGPPLPTEPSKEVDWSGALDLQIAIRSGESDTLDAATGVSLVRKKRERLFNDRTPISELTLGVTGAYGESDGDVDTQRASANERYRYFLNGRVYLLQLFGVEHDDGRNLDLRATAGLGAGYVILENSRRSLSTDGALTYEYEEWEDLTESDEVREEDHINLRLGMNYVEHLTESVTLTDNLLVIPSLDDAGEFRLLNSLALTAPLNDRTFFRTEWRAEYESDPGRDVEEWDNLFSTGVRYEF